MLSTLNRIVPCVMLAFSLTFSSEALATGAAPDLDTGKVAGALDFLSAATISVPEIAPLTAGLADPSALPRLQAESKPVWERVFEAGATFTGGNTKKRDFDGKIEVKGTWESDRFSAYARAEWGEAEQEIVENGVKKRETDRNRNRQTAGVKWEHDVSDRTYLFGKQDFERDEFQDLKFRSTSSAGIGYQLIETEKHVVSAEVGPGYEYSDYYDDDSRSDLIGRVGENWTWKISEDWSFVQGLEFISNLEEVDDDFRSTLTADLRHQVSKNLYLSFGVEHRYHAEPAYDDRDKRLDRQDWLAMIKLGWTF